MMIIIIVMVVVMMVDGDDGYGGDHSSASPYHYPDICSGSKSLTSERRAICHLPISSPAYE
jgi:hypothetical protein